MTIAEVCIAAKAEGLSYGNYVAKYLTVARDSNPVPTVQAKKPGLKRDQRCRQYTAAGAFVAEFESVAQAATAMKTGIENILRVLRGTSDTCLGYQWRYAFDPTPVKRNKVICQYTADGELVAVYPTSGEASLACRGNIYRAIQSGRMAGGFYWKREFRN